MQDFKLTDSKLTDSKLCQHLLLSSLFLLNTSGLNTAYAGKSQIALPYGPDTCVAPYVWRETIPSDHVCVTGDVRDQAAADNAAAASRRNPNGSFGSDTCVNSYVWREAFTGDHVCVLPQLRSQAAFENSQANLRKASDPLNEMNGHWFCTEVRAGANDVTADMNWAIVNSQWVGSYKAQGRSKIILSPYKGSSDINFRMGTAGNTGELQKEVNKFGLTFFGTRQLSVSGNKVTVRLYCDRNAG